MSEESRNVTCCCAEGRCKNPIRKFYPIDFPCREFKKLVNEGKNPTNCRYYSHLLDRHVAHNKKSGKGLKRKRQVEQRKAREAKRKEKKV